MAVICFVTFEIHPTTRGGVGVLLHHAATNLLARGHEVVFLLDVPKKQFRKFNEFDRLKLPNSHNCRAHDARAMTADFPWPSDAEIPCGIQRRVAAYAHAYKKLLIAEPNLDFVEFIEYTGIGYYAMRDRLFGREPEGVKKPTIGVRLHNPLELIDRFSPTSEMGRSRYGLYGFERGGIALAEAVLTPTRPYYEAYFKDDYALCERRVVVSQSPKQPLPAVNASRDERANTITFVGRMWHFKGVDQLVHAAVALLRDRPELDWRFECIGPDSKESPFHGSFTEYLLTMVPEAMRERFEFTGNLSHEQIAERLQRSAFAVFPNRFESFCYALHETYDAGVPVVINELPGYAAFFEDGKNCVAYDGTTEGLTGAMARMIDDPALRERVRKPYEVATEPLGTFYDDPAPRVALADADSVVEPGDALVLVLCPSRVEQARPTLEALARQTHRRFRTVCLVGAEPDSEETLWLLGRAWHARSPDGTALGGDALTTAEGLAILRAGDKPEPAWLGSCMGALACGSQLHAAGTWGTRGGRLAPTQLDVCPETWAYEHGGTLTRLVHRTKPGRVAIDLFDTNLGPLGEIGLVLERCAHADGAAGGHRCAVLPEPMVSLAAEPEIEIADGVWDYLAHRCLTPFGDRMAIWSGLARRELTVSADRLAVCEDRLRRLHVEPGQLYDHARVRNGVAGGRVPDQVIVEHKLRLAHELGGRDLVKIAMRKLAQRVGIRSHSGKGAGDAES